ncbi:MAG: anthranilate synthase component I family protein [Acidimicrobiales bacterium]
MTARLESQQSGPFRTDPFRSSVFKPDRSDFAAQAAAHTVVPVWVEVMGDTETPVSLFMKLAGGQERAFLLESVEHGQSWGRFSFIGWDPALTVVADREGLSLEGRVPPGSVPDGLDLEHGVLGVLESLLSGTRIPGVADLPPLHSGLVGYLGYDVVREIERLPSSAVDDHGHPDAIISVIGPMAAFDHWRQRIYLIENAFIRPGSTPGAIDAAYTAASDRLAATVNKLRQRLAATLDSPPGGDPPAEVTPLSPPGAYPKAVTRAREYMAAGDIFQVALSQRFDLTLDADPVDLYRVLRQVNPSPYMYLLRHPRVTLVGSSPERMVAVRDSQVISRPIAGTRPRGADPEADEDLARELAAHPKERAEHVMLVDLARNDLGRVCEFGSEEVTDLMVLERYSHVMHLTSQVVGRLREGSGPIDVLRATFPAGTVSGAPKVRAMEIIDELESVRRGPYAGVVGYFDFSGNVDTAIAIRTMVIGPGGRASVQAGAGIVVDSDPAAEDAECANKAAALLAAVPAARRMTAARQRSVAAAGGNVSVGQDAATGPDHE